MGLTEEGLLYVPGLASRWVRLTSGARAHYVTSGDTGPAVVLLHGGINGSSGTAGWRFMATFLGANGFRVYCPDQPGYGLSETRGGFMSHPGRLGIVQFIKEFTEALCLDTFHLGGNSMGCNNAVQFAMEYPGRIISLALIAGSIGDLTIWPSVPDNIRPPYNGTEEGMRKMMESIIFAKGAISPDLIAMRTLAANKQLAAQKGSRTERERLTDDANLRQKLSTKGRFDNLEIPGIYLYGRQDPRPVENGYAQEDLLPHIQFFYPEQCGHQGQTDQPEMFNQVFLEFFRDGKVGRNTADWAGVSTRRPENPDLVE
jgi:2-hydroxy-6-oxonona-2,4-dienedioate hydrolase